MDRLSNGQEKEVLKNVGRERLPLREAKSQGPMNPNERMDVTLLIRRPAIDDLLEKVKAPENSTFLSREAFEASYCIDLKDLELVQGFANEHQLNVEEVHVAGGTVKLSGTAAHFNRAFGIQLEKFEHPDFTFRSHQDQLKIPEELKGIVEAVFGLDNRPQARPHFQLLKEVSDVSSRANVSGQSYTPNQVANFYQFPSENRGATESVIGLIELGGGYNEQDIQDYFSKLGIQAPTLTSVSVDGASNQPTGDPNGPDGEVMLDIEVAGAVVPGAKIVVYFAPNTDAGFLNAIKTAIHDTTNQPSVISISWGSAEANWTEQAMKAMDQAFQDAATLGVTICCAAGDQGSADGMQDGRVHVDFPASSPHVLACGGTQLLSQNGQITQEVVWYEGPTSSTGGGVSEIFDLPDWQKAVQVPPSANPSGNKGRGVPDVAGNADPTTGYQVQADGSTFIVGGTSAVAPLWAGLIALINQRLGRSVGFINPSLYLGSVQQAFRDITQGQNDSSTIPKAYQAQPGWDACTGLGTPIGVQLVDQLLNIKTTQ